MLELAPSLAGQGSYYGFTIHDPLITPAIISTKYQADALLEGSYTAGVTGDQETWKWFDGRSRGAPGTRPSPPTLLL